MRMFARVVVRQDRWSSRASIRRSRSCSSASHCRWSASSRSVSAMLSALLGMWSSPRMRRMPMICLLSVVVVDRVVPPTPGHVTRGSEAPRRFSCGDDRLGVFLDQGADVPGAFRAHPARRLDPADREVHLFPGRDPAGERLGVFLVGERVLFPVPDRVPHAVPGAFPAPRSRVPRAVLVRVFPRSPRRVPAFLALFPSACSRVPRAVPERVFLGRVLQGGNRVENTPRTTFPDHVPQGGNAVLHCLGI